MQRIGKTVAAMKWESPRNLPALEVIKQEIFAHPLIAEFSGSHPDLSMPMLERSLSKLDQAIKEQEHCNQCPGLAQCPNLIKGHQAKLVWSGIYIETMHSACTKWKVEQAQKERENLVQSHHIPKEVLTATFQNFIQDAQRFEAFRALMQFCLHVEPGSNGTRMKGIYLYGPLGVGKSYLMAATARRLADRGISSLMVYTPDFFREIKESIQEQSLQQKISVIKKVPVLILDDIGAESMTPWIRDEILGTILQYRIAENLPTLYTSNYNYELLEEHLAHSAKGGVETLKGKRIMERIVHYTDAYFVDGSNRRKK
jgi:primosomal protein DnaI